MSDHPAVARPFRADGRDTLSPRRAVRIVRVTASGAQDQDDVAAVEEPLEIRLHDRPFAVIMRTPGEDRQLAAGFLLAEGVIAHADDLGAVEHCRHPEHPKVHNVVNVFLLGAAAARLPELLAARRNVLSTSSCGICGRVTIESLQTRATPLEVSRRIARAVLQKLPAELRARQPLFDETGALHAAALFTIEGECVAIAEDVGRHNAVDKVVGQMLLDGRLPLDDHVLVVSGRASYEIVQKAWLAGVGIICSVSAPSSLAIDLAHEAGITLVGFARPAGFNIYSHAPRLEL
ncbi:formate dehydrogenase accessory sulfurtransferase FdhD [soil metagenome]